MKLNALGWITAAIVLATTGGQQPDDIAVKSLIIRNDQGETVVHLSQAGILIRRGALSICTRLT